jgi:hypothetical protein
MTSGLKIKSQNDHHVQCVPAKRFAIEPLWAPCASDLDYANNARLSHQDARQLFDVLDNPSMKQCQKSSASTYHIQKDPFNFPENCKSQDTMIMSVWLDEWQTAPNEPLPSNLYALSLLKETASMNQEIHARNTREHHWTITIRQKNRLSNTGGWGKKNKREVIGRTRSKTLRFPPPYTCGAGSNKKCWRYQSTHLDRSRSILHNSEPRGCIRTPT